MAVGAPQLSDATTLPIADRGDGASSLAKGEPMAARADFRVCETLRSGVEVIVRALKPGDREKIERAVRGLDRESIYTRLFTYVAEMTEAGLDRIMHFDPDSEVVLIVTLGSGDDETVIGSGRYIVQPGGETGRSAEVAFVVEEDYHGQGIAGRLLHHLASIGRAQGIARFEASVLPRNKAMLSVFSRSGLPMQKHVVDGEVHVTLTL